MDHYRSARIEVDGVFDYLCEPLTHIFRLWIQQHPQFKDFYDEQQTKNSSDIAGAVKDKMTYHDPSDAGLEGVLEYFDLIAEEDKQWYEDHLNGTRYWEKDGDGLTTSDEDSDGSGPEPSTGALKQSKVPDRIRAYSREYRLHASQSPFATSGSNPIVGHSFPVSGNSLRFSSVSPRISSYSQSKSSSLPRKESVVDT